MILIGLVILFFFCTSTLAFRCGSRLVTSGDTKMQVYITCRRPKSKEKACEGRQTTAGMDKDGKIKKSKKCANKLDVWYYNCGNNDYIYALTLKTAF